MKIYLHRTLKGPATCGYMCFYADDGAALLTVTAIYTLEDQVRNGPKVPGKTAIPAGTYEVIVSWSDRFKKYMPLLLRVPGFDGVRIHSGNTVADTEGCILVGERTNGVDEVYNSRSAYRQVFALIKSAVQREKVWIEIV